MDDDSWIDVRGLRFPDDPALLSDAMRGDLAEAARNTGFARHLLSLAKPDDRAVVLGAGCGLAPAVLAGALGMRHVHVIEPDPDRQAYFARMAEANGLVRLTLSAALRIPPQSTLLVADMTGMPGSLPDAPLPESLRGAVVRLREDFASVRAAMARLAAEGLQYFPRHSSGAVICCLRKWN